MTVTEAMEAYAVAIAAREQAQKDWEAAHANKDAAESADKTAWNLYISARDRAEVCGKRLLSAIESSAVEEMGS